MYKYIVLFLNHNLLWLSPLGYLGEYLCVTVTGTGCIAVSIFMDVARVVLSLHY